MNGDATDRPPPPSRPVKGVLRERFEDKQDKTIDDAMGHGETWAKKIRNGKQGVLLDEVPKLLAVLGLKIVSAERICITEEQLAHYKACETLATGALKRGPVLIQDWDSQEAQP